jgi:hypothetical protein
MIDASSLEDTHLNGVIELSLVLRLIWWKMSAPSLQKIVASVKKPCLELFTLDVRSVGV